MNIFNRIIILIDFPVPHIWSMHIILLFFKLPVEKSGWGLIIGKIHSCQITCSRSWNIILKTIWMSRYKICSESSKRMAYHPTFLASIPTWFSKASKELSKQSNADKQTPENPFTISGRNTKYPSPKSFLIENPTGKLLSGDKNNPGRKMKTFFYIHHLF